MKKIFLFIGLITLFSACQKDFSVWKKINDKKLQEFEANLGNNVSGVTEYWKSSSGLLVEVIHRGQTGIMPKLSSDVLCKYWGEFVDGKRFEDATETPILFTVGGVIKGWQEILCQMPKGSHFRIFVPYELAYGKNGVKYTNFYVPPYSTLIYDMEIVDVYQNIP